MCFGAYWKWRFSSAHKRILSYRGQNAVVNEAIDCLDRSFLEKRELMDQNLRGMKGAVRNYQHLSTLIDNWIGQTNHSCQSPVRLLFQRLADELCSSIPVPPHPAVVLSKESRNLHIPHAGPLEYFVEVEYLSRRSFLDCYTFTHEIGHTFYYEFIKQANAIDVISRGFAKLIRLIEPRMSLDEHRLARNFTSVIHWLMEFVADEATVIAMGPVIPCFWYREQCSEWDFRKGGWSHPPPSVRFNFMKKRALQVSSLESYENEWTNVL